MTEADGGPRYRNVSDLFLASAAKEIEKRDFNEAAHFFVMVITEFDEDADLVGFLSHHLNKLDRESADVLIDEIAQEMIWLCPQAHVSAEQRSKMVAFRDLSASLFESYGYSLETRERKCPEKGMDDSDQVANIIVAKKKMDSSPLLLSGQ